MSALFYRAIIVALCTWICSVPLWARSFGAELFETSEQSHYRELAAMPIDTLYHKALKASADHSKSDSIPIYLTLGIIRYFADGEKARESATCIKACNMLASYYLYDGYDYANSYRYLGMAKNVMDKTGDKSQEYEMLTTLAELHHLCGSITNEGNHKSRALELYRQNFRSCLKQKDWQNLALTFINLCSTALYNESVDIQEEMGLLRQNISTSHPLAEYALAYGEAVEAYRRGAYRTALGRFDMMAREERVHNLGDRFRILPFANKFHTFLLTNERDSVEHYLNLSAEIASETGKTDFLYSIYEHYADHLLAHSDSANYSRYKLKAFLVEDSLQRNGTAQRVSQMESQLLFDTINNFLTQRRLKQRQLAFIVVIACLLLFIALYLLYNYRKTKTRLEHLYLTNRELAKKEFLYTALQNEAGEETAGATAARPESYGVYQRVMEALNTSPAIFEPDFTVNMLSDMTGIKTRTISHAISENTQLNFTALLSKLRIMEACRRMADNKNYGKYTIEAISLSVGFKSRTNFSSAFKKQTGMTPTEYMKISRKSAEVAVGD